MSINTGGGTVLVPIKLLTKDPNPSSLSVREVLPSDIDCRVSSRDLSEMRAQLEVAQTGSQTERCDN